MKRNKSVTLNKLTKTIKEIASKEFSKMLKEQMKINPVFDKVKDKKSFIDWLMRYYFDESKNKNKAWWPRQKVTKDNVLEYLSNPSSNFPLSPTELVDDWNIKGFLGTKFKSITSAELDDMDTPPKKAKGSSVYHSGERTLKDIGKETGDLTAAMIQKLEKSGLQKLFKVLETDDLVDMDEEELDNFFSKIFEKIDVVRKKVAVEYAKALKDTAGDIKKFIQELIKRRIITAVDVRIMTPDEIEMLVYLMDKPETEIVEYLRGDAIKDDNKIKSFQAAVAKELYGGKRGRPKKKEKA